MIKQKQVLNSLRLLALWVCCLYSTQSLKAQSISCYQYKLEIHLKDGSSFIAEHIRAGMYLQPFESFEELVQYYSQTPQPYPLNFYLHLNSIQIDDQRVLKYCLEDDKITVFASNILSVREIEINSCNPELIKPEYDHKYTSHILLYPLVTTEFDVNEINMLAFDKPSFISLYMGGGIPVGDIARQGDTNGFHIVSFNDTMDMDDLKLLLMERWCIDFKSIPEDVSYEEIKEALKELNIIVFQWYRMGC